MKVGKKTTSWLHIVGIFCALHSLIYGGNWSKNVPQLPASDGFNKNSYENFANYAPRAPNYVADEIIVKFHKEVAGKLEEGLRNNKPLEQIPLDDSLDSLGQRFHIQKITPVFRSFKQQITRLQRLAQKEKWQLSKRELHLLKRIRRSPQNNAIPELDRIYRLEVKISGNQTLERVVEAYNRNPLVEYAELNYIVTIDSTPNDPYFPFQWSLHNTGQMYPASGRYNDPPGALDADIDAPEAWDIQTGSGDIIVAVADTGVDYNHRDIDDNMWTDANGYHGYDFVNNDNYPMDDHGHGTHCAGVIAAEGNNGLDIAGVCWKVKIMALKSLDETGSGSYADAAEAFYYAVNNGADIISNSWSSSEYSQTMAEAIDYAYSQGVVIVASAGNQNSSTPRYPANNDYVIAVAATNSLDEKAAISNYGDWVDIAAPGVDTLSLRAPGSDAGTPYDNYTTIMSGTSMACPHVSGACALLLAENPGLTVDNVYDILVTKTDPISEGICLSDGRLNLRKVIKPLNFDRCYYRCRDEVYITLIDFDRQGQPAVVVSLWSDGGDYETLALESATRPWLFTTAVPIEMADPVVEDGVLQVSHGQTITVTYEEPNDGTGNPVIKTDQATIDCQKPLISNVQINAVTCLSAMVRFETDEPTTARLRCGVSCEGPYFRTGTDRQLTINHLVVLENLVGGLDWYFVIEANDIAGNQTTDDNNGQCYQFTTPDRPVEIYVPADYPTIQEAIDAAIDGTTIIVADGVYRGPGNRDIDFKGKVITVRSAHGPENCIIDCQRNGRAFYFRNNEDQTSILDGFTITNGYTTGKGGGIKCYIGSPTIRNCIISNNHAGQRNEYHCGGAGIHILDSNPRIINCIITDNYGFNHGGIYIESGNVDIINCVIMGNRADYVSHMGVWSYGGGICSQSSNLLLKNCLIANNWSYRFSGGLDCNRGSVEIINCSIVNNAAGEIYGGVSNINETNITIMNSIIWGNQAPVVPQLSAGMVAAYCDVEDGYPGTGNIDLDPCFVSGPLGDYYLSQIAAGQDNDSPCMDAGSDLAANLGMDIFTTRTDGVVDSGIVDMGYHYPVANPADIDKNGNVDLVDFAILGGQWQREPGWPPADIAPPGGDGIVNINDLALLVENWLYKAGL